MLKKLNKKAFEIQFFWIFVMLAGGLILLFFFSLSHRYKTVSEEKLAFSISDLLDTIITEVIQSPDTVPNPIPIPKYGVGFSCSDVCACDMKIGRVSYPITSDKLVFAPGLLKDLDLILWSKPFKMPFRVGNFLYITNKKVLYVFVKDDSVASAFFEDLRKSVEDKVESVFVSNANEVFESGYLYYRFVFVGQEPGSIDDSFASHEDVSAVYFSDGRAFDSVKFYKKQDGVAAFEPDASAPDVFYLFSENLPLSLAAVFADDHQMFSCNVKEVFKRLSVIADLHAQRIDQIKPLLKGELSKCTTVLGALPDLNQIKSESQKLSEVFDKPESLEKIAGLKNIIYAPGGLERKNRVYIEEGCRFGVY